MSEAITGSALMRLSSSGTLWQKVILPAVWLTGFGLGALSTALGIGTPPLHLEQRIMFPVAWFLGLGLFAWRCFPLKQVWLAPEGVVVAGLRRKIAIPFSDIEAVRGSAVGSPVHIVLELKRPSAFGTRIRFMPTFRFMAFSPHPTFTMLSELVAAQRGEKIEAR